VSKSALIAFENSDETFDLYWSHNGADEFYLKPYLEDVISGKRSRTLPDVEPKLPEGMDDPQFQVVDSLKKAIVPQPVQRRVRATELGANIDFLAYEGFYVVTDQGVRIYYPMWTYPGIFIALREMFDLEIYDSDLLEDTSTTGMGEATPVTTISSDGYSIDRFENVRYRRFFESNYLGILQTISGTVNSAVEKAELQSETLVNTVEQIRIVPKKVENLYQPYRVGNGVLIHFSWEEGSISQRLDSIISQASSIQVDVSLRLLQESDGIPTKQQFKRYEEELVERAYQHFGAMIYPEQIQPFASRLRELSETYAPNKGLRGREYRVIDTDGETALLKPTEQYGKTGTVSESKLSSDDVQIVDLEQTPDEFIGVTRHLENGDIVMADINDAETPAVIQSIQLLQRIPMVMTDVDTVPDFVQELYDNEIEESQHKNRFQSARTYLESKHETITDSTVSIGELQVTNDPKDTVWKGLESGKISEQVYGRFQLTSGQPHEVLLCNPRAKPFWFAFLIHVPMTGFARYWRGQFGCEYTLDVLSAPPENTDASDDELPQGAEVVMDQLQESFQLLMNAQHGMLSDEKQTKVLTLTGDDKEEALDNAYVIRDALKENGCAAECEYLGLHDIQPDWLSEPLHEINLYINHDQ
jgi:hypothetical protein